MNKISPPAGSSRRTVSKTCRAHWSGAGNRAFVLGRAERRMMPGIIGLRQPQDRQRRGALLEDLGAEPLGHRAVAVASFLQHGAGGIVDRPAPRPIAAGGVIDPAMPVGVLEIGRAGRNIGAGDRGLAVPAQPFGQGRHMQRAAGRAAQPVGKIGVAGRAADEALALVERHRIAEEAVPRRHAAGGDRGGARPRRRREDAAMRGKIGRALRQLDEKRRRLGIDQVPAQAVADDDDGPGSGRACDHDATLFSLRFRSTQTRR